MEAQAFGQVLEARALGIRPAPLPDLFPECFQRVPRLALVPGRVSWLAKASTATGEIDPPNLSPQVDPARLRVLGFFPSVTTYLPRACGTPAGHPPRSSPCPDPRRLSDARAIASALLVGGPRAVPGSPP